MILLIILINAEYPDQRIMIVSWQDYIHLVPCVRTKEGYFIKTIIPSRKATREYLSKGIANETD